MESDLHIVDRFDEIEEGFATFGIIGDVASGGVSIANDGIVVELFADVFVKIEFFGRVHVDLT